MNGLHFYLRKKGVKCLNEYLPPASSASALHKGNATHKGDATATALHKGNATHEGEGICNNDQR